MSTRICVVGGGLAGALPAWRLASGGGGGGGGTGGGTAAGAVTVELLTGRPGTADATAASRGLVRAFETDPAHAAAARASLAELLADPVLREWAGYRRLGSTYVLADGPPDPAQFAALLSGAPGAVHLVTAADLAAAGWHGLPEQAVAVVEEEAGCLDPDWLRRSAIADLAGRRGVAVVAEPLQGLRVRPDGVRVEGRSGSWGSRGSRDFDAVVIAAGPWTPALLHSCGLPAEGLTTKAIQYTVVPTRGPGRRRSSTRPPACSGARCPAACWSACPPSRGASIPTSPRPNRSWGAKRSGWPRTGSPRCAWRGRARPPCRPTAMPPRPGCAWLRSPAPEAGSTPSPADPAARPRLPWPPALRRRTTSVAERTHRPRATAPAGFVPTQHHDRDRMGDHAT
ncbi:FAD-dependent oxidoreductase [Catenulispora yoronensis]